MQVRDQKPYGEALQAARQHQSLNGFLAKLGGSKGLGLQAFNTVAPVARRALGGRSGSLVGCGRFSQLELFGLDLFNLLGPFDFLLPPGPQKLFDLGRICSFSILWSLLPSDTFRDKWIPLRSSSHLNSYSALGPTEVFAGIGSMGSVQ